MSAIDWKDPKRTDVFHFVMVDPNNLDASYGDIEGVQLASTTLTYGYYTDTRYASRITFLKGNNYVRNAWIRIIHEVPSKGYVNELGTFIPVSPSVSYSGATTETLDLQSPLWGLSNHYCTNSFTFAKGQSYKGAFQLICNRCDRPYLLNNPNDFITQSAIVYDAGTSFLDILFDLSGSANNRIDLDGHGRITLSPLVNFQYMSPSWDIDADDPRSIVIQGSVKMETLSDEIPNRIIVMCGGYVGYADLPDGAEFSAAQRGYIKAQTYSASGLKNNDQCTSLAQAYISQYVKVNQWGLQTMYFPAKCGETVRFTLNGVKHLCMIQAIDPINLDTMTMQLTLREVESNG